MARSVQLGRGLDVLRISKSIPIYIRGEMSEKLKEEIRETLQVLSRFNMTPRLTADQMRKIAPGLIRHLNKVLKGMEE